MNQPQGEHNKLESLAIVSDSLVCKTYAVRNQKSSVLRI